MKKIVISLFALLLCCGVATAQTQQTAKTSMASPHAMKGATVVKKHAAAPADAICGVYLVNSPKNDVDKIKVRVSRASDGTYRARVIWLVPSTNADGTERTDALNKDKSLRNRKPTDITLCWNLTYDAQEKMWKGGTLYDPTTGKTFSIQLKKAANGKDIDARYYKGKPAFGMDQLWKQTK